MTQFTISHQCGNAGSDNMPNSYPIKSIGYNTQSLHNSCYTLLLQGYTRGVIEQGSTQAVVHTQHTGCTGEGRGRHERMGTGEGGDAPVDVKMYDLLHKSVKFFQNYSIIPYLSIFAFVNGENALEIP